MFSGEPVKIMILHKKRTWILCGCRPQKSGNIYFLRKDFCLCSLFDLATINLINLVVIWTVIINSQIVQLNVLSLSTWVPVEPS